MTTTIPVEIDDPINARILAVSEDQISGFHPDPFEQISLLSEVKLPVVLERIRAMLEGGTIRRVRQTLISAKLAPGALVAWQVPQEQLDDAFDFMSQQDLFSGHVVIRSTDAATSGSQYRLWTTVKVPAPFSMPRHCDFLCEKTGAQLYKLMPAKRMFTLGVGHVRRRSIDPGSKTDQPGRVIDTQGVNLTEQEWRVVAALKRELAPDEIRPDLWQTRAREAGVSKEVFFETCRSLQKRGLLGRFSTFLEHVKPLSDGKRVTRFNALFHWAVPVGREIEAGCEVGRHEILTHAYWREGGPEFGNVNVMAVAHGLDKDLLMKHKTAIDQHLASTDVPVSYTNVFWGGRSEIKPSEISPIAYRQWCGQMGVTPQQMMT